MKLSLFFKFMWKQMAPNRLIGFKHIFCKAPSSLLSIQSRMEEKRSNLKRHFNACSVTSTPVRDEQRRWMNKQGSCMAAYRAGMVGFNSTICIWLWLHRLVLHFQNQTLKGIFDFGAARWCQKMMSAWLIGTFVVCSEWCLFHLWSHSIQHFHATLDFHQTFSIS